MYIIIFMAFRQFPLPNRPTLLYFLFHNCMHVLSINVFLLLSLQCGVVEESVARVILDVRMSLVANAGQV